MMFGIRVELLTGKYVASAYNDRNEGEWPPHPSRLLSALLEVWGATDQDARQWNALQWLESLPPPRIRASEAYVRLTAPTFVPVNDTRVVSDPRGARARLERAEVALESASRVADQAASEKARSEVDGAKTKLISDSRKRASDTKYSTKAIESAQRILPDSRLRMPRTFPVMVPHVPSVTFVWTDDPTGEVRTALEQLCARIIRLGHSSSLISAHLDLAVENEGQHGCIEWLPRDDGEEMLRVPETGQVSRLYDAFQRHQGVELRVLPTGFQRYGRHPGVPVAETPRSCFRVDWMVFERVGGSRFPIIRVADIAEAFRRSILSHAEDPIPEVLTGHKPDGQPTRKPHVAYVPLPYVASEFANGDILGVAIVMPSSITLEERRALHRAVGKWEQAGDAGADSLGDDDVPVLQLTLGRAGIYWLRRVAFGESARTTLRSGSWCRPSRVWISATPVALDRNPGELHARDPKKRAAAFEKSEETVARSCEHIGLPRPDYVEVTRSTVLPGGAKPRSFPSFPRDRAKHRRVLVNARIIFSEPVTGPVMLGAGRYAGLGLFRPVRTRSV